MAHYVIKIEGFANGQPCPIAGQYLQSFNHHTADGTGEGVFTKDPREAKMFFSVREALDFWKVRSETVPTRRDGEPNRPLTCSTVTIVSLANAIMQDVAAKAH